MVGFASCKPVFYFISLFSSLNVPPVRYSGPRISFWEHADILYLMMLYQLTKHQFSCTEYIHQTKAVCSRLHRVSDDGDVVWLLMCSVETQACVQKSVMFTNNTPYSVDTSVSGLFCVHTNNCKSVSAADLFVS